MEDIIVGNREACTTNSIWRILRKATKVKANWKDFARFLISEDEINTFQQDVILSKMSVNDAIMKTLDLWVAGKGSNAKLAEIIYVVEEECEDTDAGEDLRLSYNLPCKAFDIQTTDFTTLSKRFQEKVKKSTVKFFPNTQLDAVNWAYVKGDILLDLMTEKKPTPPTSTVKLVRV